MNTDPLVSIVIPVYNSEKYLEECLDSVLGQTYHNLEIICVNDGSSDSSGTILERYALADKRIQIITKENGGPASARNDGLSKAKGKYIQFLDSDDFFDKELIRITVDKAIRTDSQIVISTGLIYDDERGTVEGLLPHQIGRAHV